MIKKAVSWEIREWWREMRGGKGKGWGAGRQWRGAEVSWGRRASREARQQRQQRVTKLGSGSAEEKEPAGTRAESSGVGRKLEGGKNQEVEQSAGGDGWES